MNRRSFLHAVLGAFATRFAPQLPSGGPHLAPDHAKALIARLSRGGGWNVSEKNLRYLIGMDGLMDGVGVDGFRLIGIRQLLTVTT